MPRGTTSGNVLDRAVSDAVGCSRGSIPKLDSGCQLISLPEGIESSTPGGKLVFAVLGKMAEIEADWAIWVANLTAIWVETSDSVVCATPSRQ